MGSVWAAHHELIGRDVAIKVTGEKVSKHREIRERFLNEARAVGKVRHPNVIDVMDVGQLPDGLLYIVFELLDGRTLEEHLLKKGRLPAGDAAMILIEVCRGLEAAHAAGIVHRDLKPANVFLHRAPGGSIAIKLLDFGISKTVDEDGVSLSVTQTGVVMGTPQYMSVEQARGRDDIDLRADVWSAGTILYELTTGRVAFDAANYNAVIDRIMHEEALPLLSSGVNEPGLQAVVSRCLAKQRSQRYQTAKELRDALQMLLATLPVGAGGLKLQGSSDMASPFGSATASVAPAKPTDDAPAPRAASRHDATLVAPPSDPRITPLRNESLVQPVTRVSDRPPSSPSLSLQPPLRRRRGPVAAIVASVAVAVGALIAFSSGGSTSTSATAPATSTQSREEAPPAQHANADPEAERARSAPPLAALPAPRLESSTRANAPSSSAPASAAASSRKPTGAHNPPLTTKPKSVTRIESAGF
jgi:eukaryotic-like serine/threonine-protein kinase